MNRVNILVFVVYITLFISVLSLVIESEKYHRSCGRSNNLCACNTTSKTAVCNGRGKLLEYLPPLPPYIENVQLHAFHFEKFTNHTLASLKYLRHLQLLNINNSTFSNMSEEAFSVLRYFPGVTLNISHNVVAENVLTKSFIGLKSVRLRYLDLRHLNISDKNGTFFDTLNGTSVNRICVSKNFLTKYDHSKFANVRNLTYLIMSQNDIKEVHLVYSFELMTLKLAYNDIMAFLTICSNNGSMFPNLEMLTLDHNSIEVVSHEHLQCLTNLKVLNLSRNKLFTFKANSFSMLPKLENLALRDMYGQIDRIDPFAFNNSNLHILSLRDNKMDLIHGMDQSSLKGCENLIDLDLSNNIMYRPKLTEEYLIRLIGHLHKLQWVALSSMRLRRIPYVMNNLSNVWYLELYGNRITEMPKDFFSHLPNLTNLIMCENSISVLREDDFPESVQRQLKMIDFSGNPFVCDCQLLWFVEWLREESFKFKRFFDYTCHNNNRNLTNDWAISAESCMLDYMTAMTIVVVLCMAIIIMSTSSLVYRQRWHIKHYIYMMTYQRYYDNREYRFDAFVIYCKEDRNWVVKEAIYNLETIGKLKLCLLERDCLLGEFTVDHIIESLDTCRKVILLLSDNFARDESCQYQLHLCQSKALRRRQNRLLVVMLKNIDERHMTHSLYALLQTTTYTEWPGDDTEAKKKFWSQFQTSLSTNTR